jgi:hypothetical protein
MKRVYPVDEKGKKILDLKSWKINNYNKIYFDSKFEWECYKVLKENNFNVDFHPESLMLMEGFSSYSLTRSKGKTKIFKSTVRPITYTPDFCIYCNNGSKVYIETKGFFRDGARIRFKLAQASLPENDFIFLIFDKPSEGVKKLKELVEIIKNQFEGSSLTNKVTEKEQEKSRKINL